MEKNKEETEKALRCRECNSCRQEILYYKDHSLHLRCLLCGNISGLPFDEAYLHEDVEASVIFEPLDIWK